MSVKIRPHHLLDILMDYGHSVIKEPHPFEASVDLVTSRILEREPIKLVPRMDDICFTCYMLEDELCQARIRDNLLMREYNDRIDDKLFSLMGFNPGDDTTLEDFSLVVKDNLDKILKVFTSPDNNPNYRKEGTIKALKMIL